MKNFYQVLDVPIFSDLSTVRRSFRELAKQLHPDLNPNLRNTTMAISNLLAAYRFLSDPTRKKAYDKKLKSIFDQSSAFSLGGIRSSLRAHLLNFLGLARSRSRNRGRHSLINLKRESVDIWSNEYSPNTPELLRDAHHQTVIRRQRDALAGTDEIAVFDSEQLVTITPEQAFYGCRLPLMVYGEQQLVIVPPRTHSNDRVTVRESRPNNGRRRYRTLRFQIVAHNRQRVRLVLPLTYQYTQAVMNKEVTFVYLNRSYTIKLTPEFLVGRLVRFGGFDLQVLIGDESLHVLNGKLPTNRLADEIVFINEEATTAMTQ